MLAIVLQAFLPGAIGDGEAKGAAVSRFICAPSGELSPKSRAAAEQIAGLLGEDVPHETLSDGHCPLCTLTHGAPLPEPLFIAAPAVFTREQVFVQCEHGFVRKGQGRPSRSRAPPFHI